MSKRGRADRSRSLRLEALEARRLLATVTLSPVADNTLYESAGGSLSNGEGMHFFVGRTAQTSDSIRRGLIRFDVSQANIPPGATVESVTLTLNMSRAASGTPRNVALHRALQAWGEGSSDATGQEGRGAPATNGDATWLDAIRPNQAWANVGGDFAASSSATTSVGGVGSYSWSSVQMVTDVVNWLSDANQNHGWILLGNESSGSTAKRFDTREHTTVAVRPRLQIEFTDPPELALTVDKATIPENGGASAATATVTRRNTPLDQALVVTLNSSDTTEAVVPSSVTIPAGQASATFAVAAVDDNLLDGPQQATLSADAAGFISGSSLITVSDHETLTLALDRTSVFENEGPAAVTATVTRNNNDKGLALTVSLNGTDGTEAVIPASLVIPGGAASATVTIDAIDDSLLDGRQSVQFTASAAGYVSGQSSLQVDDHETLTITIDVAEINENEGPQAARATVRRSNTDRQNPLLVTINNGDPTELGVPGTVTIPAGAESAEFDIDAVDDLVADGTQTVTVAVTATGYVGGSQNLQVLDDEIRATLSASRDNTLYEDPQGGLSNGAGHHLFAGRTSNSLIRRGLIAFDVASLIPANATVRQVTLTLHMSRSTGGAQQVALHRVLSDWGEGAADAPGQEGGGAAAQGNDATWLHTFFDTSNWNQVGGDFAAASSAAASVADVGSYTWNGVDLAADVQFWLANPQQNFGWLLRGNEAVDDSSKRFDTRENPTVNFQPQLTVDYVLNRAPRLNQALGDLATFEYLPVDRTIPLDTFVDPDNDPLQYSVTLVGGGALPGWLSFDSASRRLTGQPRRADLGTWQLQVTASDGRTPPLSGSTTFTIDVQGNLHPWQNPLNPLDVNLRDGATALDALVLINFLNANGSGNLAVPPAPGFLPPPFMDVAGNDFISPRDVLIIINFLNKQAGGEGEGDERQRFVLEAPSGSTVGSLVGFGSKRESSAATVVVSQASVQPVPSDPLRFGQPAGDSRPSRITAQSLDQESLDAVLQAWDREDPDDL